MTIECLECNITIFSMMQAVTAESFEKKFKFIAAGVFPLILRSIIKNNARKELKYSITECNNLLLNWLIIFCLT